MNIDAEAVTELTNKLLEKDNEITRLRTALHLVGVLDSKKDIHLGRPRWDGTCIHCVTYFALNNGSYGVEAPTERFKEAILLAIPKSIEDSPKWPFIGDFPKPQIRESNHANAFREQRKSASSVLYNLR